MRAESVEPCYYLSLPCTATSRQAQAAAEREELELGGRGAGGRLGRGRR